MLVSKEDVIEIIDNENFTVDRKFERIKGLKGADQGTYIRLDETVERFIRAGRNLDKDQIIYMLNRVPKVEFTPQMAHDVLKRYCEQFDIGIQQAWNYLDSEVEKR